MPDTDAVPAVRMQSVRAGLVAAGLDIWRVFISCGDSCDVAAHQVDPNFAVYKPSVSLKKGFAGEAAASQTNRGRWVDFSVLSAVRFRFRRLFALANRASHFRHRVACENA